VLRALTGLFRRPAREGEHAHQLRLALDDPPRTADDLLARLRTFGLTRIDRCRLTRNRAVMVSFSGGELRIHAGYLGAPPEVLRAVVVFVQGRTRADRCAARAVILAHRVEVPPRIGRRPRTRPEDEGLAVRLTAWHRRYNDELFEGRLRHIAVRVSRRMRSRLGHYSAASPAGEPPEIAISRRHVRRHGWEEALHTLLHEMVHQWQDESGLPIDHGARFRAKARAVGIAASARRAVDACAP
jgi:hypothetical protein